MRAIAVLLLASGVAHADTPADEVKRRVDDDRKAAGLGPVAIDAKLSKGCMEHARYMLLNRDTDAMVGLNAHTQRAGLPGASAAGAACGKSADLFPGVADLGTAVEGWMAGIYHRRPILDPTLTTIGVGYAKLPDGTLMAALMLVDGKEPHGAWPVAYPADKTIGVPLEYGNEIPNPIPHGGAGGYPITLQFPPFDKVTGVTATLTSAGKAVPFYLSDPVHPATSFGQYGVISVIPKQRLRANTAYDVTISAAWKGVPGTWRWSFTTLPLRAVDANDAAAITAAIGVASTVRGTVVNTGMIDTQTVFLALTDDHGRKLVSVVMPLAVWKQVGRGAKPASLVGATLDVEGTPQLVAHTYINVPIGAANQLTVVRPKG